MVKLEEHAKIVINLAENYKKILTLEEKIAQDKNIRLYIELISPNDEVLSYLLNLYYTNRK